MNGGGAKRRCHCFFRPCPGAQPLKLPLFGCPTTPLASMSSSRSCHLFHTCKYTACCCSHPQQQHCLQHPLVNKQHSVQSSPRKSANSSQQNKWPCIRALSWIDSQHSFSPGKLSAPHHHQHHHLGVATRPRCLVYLNRPRPPATTSKLAHLPSRVGSLNIHLIHRA